ncbi:hypothetical protein CLOM_g10302 [Closterium sp. NIES-68]|nr:hypothetical protein CLOM_g10302 [Closterium sp. NIES-68]GJP78132.1 hypothetical protein CLOP_g8466 [Closterium sp. NIES-67]
MRPSRPCGHVPTLMRALARAYQSHSPLPASASAFERLVPALSGSAPCHPPSHPLASHSLAPLASRPLGPLGPLVPLSFASYSPAPTPLPLPAVIRHPPARHLSTEGLAGGSTPSEQTGGAEAAGAGGEERGAQGAGQEGEGGGGGEGSAAEEEWRRAAEEARERLLLAYADMENLRQRAKRDVDAARLFAVQGFAKGLADVADNLSRAAASVSLPPRSVSPAAAQEEGSGGAGSGGRDPEALLKALLDGVVMTEKQLLQVFQQHGMERHDPLGHAFDPNLHNAVFELDDPSKEPGTIAHVLKVGYTLHGRVVRPADVGVVKRSQP